MNFSKFELPKVDLPKVDIPKVDWAGHWDRISAELGDRSHDLADELSKRARQEARSFAKREKAFEEDARHWLANPAVQVAGAAVLGFVVGVAASGARKAAIQGSEAFAGDWFAVLKAEHRATDALLEALMKTTSRQKTRRAALFAKINYALNKHALQEETVIYPCLRDAEIDGMAKHLYSDHADIKILLHGLAETPKGDPSWIEKVRALQATVTHHVYEEETEVFPRFHAQMSPQQNAKLTLMLHREGLKLA